MDAQQRRLEVKLDAGETKKDMSKKTTRDMKQKIYCNREDAKKFLREWQDEKFLKGCD